jgi:predicted PurR-regulated permease PerM
MAVLSLLPAVGAALIWVPVSLYLLATGAVWQGIALMAYGVLVISTVDNFLRPVLVGNDTKMPDYLVLVSTLGGIGIFGINGLVIGPVIAAMFIAAWIYSLHLGETRRTIAPQDRRDCISWLAAHHFPEQGIFARRAYLSVTGPIGVSPEPVQASPTGAMH